MSSSQQCKTEKNNLLALTFAPLPPFHFARYRKDSFQSAMYLITLNAKMSYRGRSYYCNATGTENVSCFHLGLFTKLHFIKTLRNDKSIFLN